MAECDNPTTGPARILDADLPDPMLSTGAGVHVTVIDTGSALPGVTGDQSTCFLHGTAVAGVVRQVAPQAHIHAVRHTDREDSEEGTVSGLVDALDRAIAATREFNQQRGSSIASGGMAGVVNISMVTCEDVPSLAEAIDRAQSEGILVTASAGNSGQCEDNEAPYPAAYEPVLAVGAVEHRVPLDEQSTPGSGKLNSGRIPAEYSSPGQWVDLYAPGGPVTVETATSAESSPEDSAEKVVIVGGPEPFTGTSFAAPVVAGTAALVSQVLPFADATQVREILESTAKPGGASEDGTAPLLVVDPAAAVAAALSRTQPGASYGATAGVLPAHVDSHLDAATVTTASVDYSVPAALSFVLALVALWILVARALR